VKRRSIILIGLVLALGIGWLLLRPHDNPRRALEEYKKQLVAKGEKLTLAELIPPPSVKTPNGASNFLSATNLFFSSSAAPTMMQIVAPGVALVGHTNSAPELTLHYQQNTRRTAELRKLLDVGVLDFNLNFGKGFLIPLPQPAQQKKAGQLAAGTTMQALHANDPAEAWQDLNATVDLIRLVENDYLDIFGLIRASLAQAAVAATWEMLQSDQSGDAQLLALQEKWRELDVFSPSEPILGMERAFGIDGIIRARMDYALTTPEPAAFPAGDDGLPAKIRGKMKTLADRYPRYWAWKASWSYEEELWYLRIMEAAIESARQAKISGAFGPAIKELNRTTTEINGLFPNRYRHFWMLSGKDFEVGPLLVKLADAEVARGLVVTAIALKRFQLQHGGYPASLDELVPAFLPRVPADFMDGKPFRYRLRPEGGFLLYSVGEDGEDNGGDATPVGGKGWLQGRDIVWPRPATAAEAAAYLNRSASATNAPGR
jgi:hypothetical protein